MQRMTILGLTTPQLKVVKMIYKILPNTKVYSIGNKLIVETVIPIEDRKKIIEQYNKTGNAVFFEDI